MKSDVIIIGAGASGLVAAIACARHGSKVTILEHKDRVGKKILATGNGKCNYTNLIQSPECYRGEDSSFALKVLSYFGVNETIEFFKELGIYPKSKDGYLYPNSEQASSVLDVLRMELEHLKVTIICEEHINSINRRSDIFIINTTSKKNTTSTSYEAKKVILATGGQASADLGSDGSGYELSKSFGHKIIQPVPALVQLKSDAPFFKTVSGVRVNTNISLFINDEFMMMEYGELQLTNYGVSGIPIFQISRFASRAIEKKEKVFLELDFMRDLSSQELFKLIRNRIDNCSYKTIEDIFIGLLNKKLSFVIIKACNIDPGLPSAKITKDQINQLVKRIKEFRVDITEPNLFQNAQVCAGGVLTQEVWENSLESKIVEGLYIVGELLDIDGMCGGYNLQWAWSTGYLAGCDAGSKTS